LLLFIKTDLETFRILQFTDTISMPLMLIMIAVCFKHFILVLIAALSKMSEIVSASTGLIA